MLGMLFLMATGCTKHHNGGSIKQTVPDRAKERSLCKKLIKIENIEDYPIFPDGRRRCYYW